MEQNGFMLKLQKVLMPIGDFLTKENHFAAISAGLMANVGITLVGSVFQILSSPPITAEIMAEGGFLATIFGWWFNLDQNYGHLLDLPFRMTVGIISVVSAFTIAYQLAKRYKINPLSSGIVSLLMFLLVAAPVQQVTLANGATAMALNTAWLGGSGLFTAILVALVSVDITNFCIKKKIVVKMPEAVPQFLQDSFTSLIPLLLNVIVLYGASVILGFISPGLTIPAGIYKLLAAPLSAINSPAGILILTTFAALLWTMGIHGSQVVYPIIFPLLIQALETNAGLFAQGLPTVFFPVALYSALGIAGGSGNTMGFTLLSLKAKSEQLRAIGKVSVVPGLFGVNEPVAFGAPVVYNPILAIPYVLSVPIIGILMWLAFKIGFMVPEHVIILSLLPIGLNGLFGSMSIKNFIFAWVMVPLSAVIYYPFFKLYDTQLAAKEKAMLENN